MDTKPALDEVHRRLKYKRLHPYWAKLEILLGLTASGIGLLTSNAAVVGRPLVDIPWEQAAAGLVLFVLGTYLAMAGHRSHLYRSANDRTALLLDELLHWKPKDRLP
jgi:hypothetical protein